MVRVSVTVWPPVTVSVVAESAAVKVGTVVKVAVTDSAAAMVTAQVVPVEVVQPVQLVKVEPEAGVAVRVTTVAGA